jgi:hypothetical protein
MSVSPPLKWILSRRDLATRRRWVKQWSDQASDAPDIGDGIGRNHKSSIILEQSLDAAENPPHTLSHLGIPKSTLSHHCLHLISVGLVEQRREGRTIRCFANCDLTQGLAQFLIDQCCMGVELVETGASEAG